MAGESRRTVLYSSKGKKLYAVRDASGKFKDIQQYSRAHAMDMRRKSKAEIEAAAKKAGKKTAKSKPAGKKPAARKPAAKKVAARKTAVKKTAAKKSVGKSLKSMVTKAVGRARKAEGAVKRAVKRAVRKATAG